MSLIDREHEHFLQTYKRLPVVVDRAEGMYVHAADGTRYLDFLGGIAVNALGHSHPKIIEAIDRQMRRYMHLSNYFYQDAQIEFVERLCAASGYERAFLTNSGTEANEGAIKLARTHGHANGKAGIIGFSGGFHGRSYGALSIMDKPRYKDGMGPFLPDTAVLPFNDAAALRDAVNETTAALVVEFLQGEGGIYWASEEFVATMFELREKFGLLIVGDEIQAGGGRTGDFLSFERFGVRPDIVTVAKGIGGGLPLGAILATESLATVWGSGQHGTTFGGNAVACAAGSAVLDELAGGVMKHARETGEILLAGLNALATEFPELVREIRGAGAIFGIELSVPSGPFVDAMLARHIIVNSTNDNVIRLLPPMIYEREHIDELMIGLRACFSEATVTA
ncbi:MAG: Acetylornithine aminotransferase apoenzyme [Chlorobi bacterium]|nr:Acetylornithine aminotransferase apoenzyme [Chlorobiota bacterium]